MRRYEALSSGGREYALLMQYVLPKDMSDDFPPEFEELFTILDLHDFDLSPESEAWDRTFAYVRRRNTTRRQKVFFNSALRFQVEDALRNLDLPIKDAEPIAMLWMLKRGRAKFAGFED